MDHFLGKATVLNILGLRFANNFLEPVWNREHIAKVEIIFDEDLALEGRARYYDGAGALRDMIQSHLLQIMALMAIEPPATIGERDLRDAVATVLRASSIKAPYQASTRRARYTAGSHRRQDRSRTTSRKRAWTRRRNTETLAEVRVDIDNWRWKGVPFILRSGKALGRKAQGSRGDVPPGPPPARGIHRASTPPTSSGSVSGRTRCELDVDVNGPGDIFSLDRTTLLAELSASELLPYGEVLEGVLTGDPLLSVRGDTAEDCWRIVEPVLEAWARDAVPLEEYDAGTSGPEGRSGFAHGPT